MDGIDSLCYSVMEKAPFDHCRNSTSQLDRSFGLPQCYGGVDSKKLKNKQYCLTDPGEASQSHACSRECEIFKKFHSARVNGKSAVWLISFSIEAGRQNGNFCKYSHFMQEATVWYYLESAIYRDLMSIHCLLV